MKVKNELTIEDFKYMENLEKQYYSDEYITNYEQAYQWYLYDPNTIKVAEDQGRIVAFINLFPVKNQIYETIKKGNFNDKNMTCDDIILIKNIIEDTNEKEINLFLSCVVVDLKYRKTNALAILLESYCDYYCQLQHRGLKINNVITDNVTLEGIKFSRRMGLKQIVASDHQSRICIGTFKNFVNKAKLYSDRVKTSSE